MRHENSVLIHAADGDVGSPTGQFAAAAGAQRIVGNPGQVEYTRRFGYHEALVRDQFPDSPAEEKFDVILDPIGGATRVGGPDFPRA